MTFGVGTDYRAIGGVGDLGSTMSAPSKIEELPVRLVRYRLQLLGILSGVHIYMKFAHTGALGPQSITAYTLSPLQGCAFVLKSKGVVFRLACRVIQMFCDLVLEPLAKHGFVLWRCLHGFGTSSAFIRLSIPVRGFHSEQYRLVGPDLDGLDVA